MHHYYNGRTVIMFLSCYNTRRNSFRFKIENVLDKAQQPYWFISFNVLFVIPLNMPVRLAACDIIRKCAGNRMMNVLGQLFPYY